MNISPQKDVQILNDLAKDYQKGIISALIGAGFSKNVSNIRYKGWYELLIDAYRYVYKDEIERSYPEYLHRNALLKDNIIDIEKYILNRIYDEDLLQLVSKYIIKKGYREAIDGYIEQNTPYAEKDGDKIMLIQGNGEKEEIEESQFEVHKQLLSCTKFINIYTTNYDNLLEFTAENCKVDDKNYKYRKDPICKGSDLSNHIGEQNIIKIHGSLPTTEEAPFEFDNDTNLRYIIAKEDYDNYKEKHEAFAYLMRIAMLSGKFCLIGFSGSDPNYTSWLNWMKDIINKNDSKNEAKVYLIDTNAKYATQTDKTEQYCKNMYNANHHVSVLHIYDKEVIEKLFPKSNTINEKASDLVEIVDNNEESREKLFPEMNIINKRTSNLAQNINNEEKIKKETEYSIGEILVRLFKYIEEYVIDNASESLELNEDEKYEKNYTLAYNYYYGKNGEEQNHDRAFEYLIKASKTKKHEKEINAMLAECYLYGKGTEVQINKAIDCCNDNNLVTGNTLYGIGESYNYGMYGLEENKEKAIQWFQKAADKDYAKAYQKLGDIYQNYKDRDKIKKAKEYYKSALKIYKKLAEEKPDKNLPYIAQIHNDIAILNNNNDLLNDAQKEFEEALEIYRKLAEKNPEMFEPDVAKTLNNLANLHRNTNDYEAAEKEYKEALEIYRKLAKKNPDAYEPYMATTLNNLAILHNNTNDYEAAEKEYKEALEIRRKLAKKNPDAYEPDVATTLNNLAILHKNTNNYEAAEKEYKEALEIYMKLAKKNPDAYVPDVATTLNNLGLLHNNTHNYEAAEKEYQEALEIRRKLAKKNRDAYEPDVVDSFAGLGLLYYAKGEMLTAIKYLKEAIEILIPYAEKYPHVYGKKLNLIKEVLQGLQESK